MRLLAFPMNEKVVAKLLAFPRASKTMRLMSVNISGLRLNSLAQKIGSIYVVFDTILWLLHSQTNAPRFYAISSSYYKSFYSVFIHRSLLLVLKKIGEYSVG